jgi:excisionase family DNA binding protein
MHAGTTTSRAVPIDEVARIEAADVVTSAGDRRVVTITMELDDGSSIDLPNRLGTFLADLVESMADGAGVSTSVLPDEMTTTVAADVIGISRPTLVKMIDRGEITAWSVGTHRRLRRADVLAARAARRDARRIAARELLEAGEAFD